jgi:hypothetical protein
VVPPRAELDRPSLLGSRADDGSGGGRSTRERADLFGDHVARRLRRGRGRQLRRAAPDEEVHAFVSELERPIGTYLYGRRIYEVMRYWETALTVAGQSPSVREYAALWQAADKIVHSG